MNEKFQQFLGVLKTKKFIFPLIGVCLFFIIIFVALNYKTLSVKILKLAQGQKRDWRYSENVEKSNYQEPYSLVNKSVSRNAAIAVNLPKNLTPEKGKEVLKFKPEIKGRWLNISDSKKIVFKPDTSLVLGNYYTAIAKMDEGSISQDFVVEEDPQILNVFPQAGSETDEKSEITILFNRPMVPLSSLEVMNPGDVPVEIVPSTEGKFKWIGTRSLQFIPEKGLKVSSSYLVKIKSEFKSMDGIQVPEFEHVFFTRKLRLDSISPEQSADKNFVNTLIYDEPISLKFNQAVDLARTKEEIKLSIKDGNKPVDLIFEYGKKQVYNEELKKDEEQEDKSLLLVFNKQDKHGRSRMWDFKAEYNLKLDEAFPLVGDINLGEKKDINFQVTDIIKDISAESERSSFVYKDLFDMQGKLVVQFFEEIDLSGSKIFADKLKALEYGEKCKKNDDGTENTDSASCIKETDKSKINISFLSEQIKRGETLKIKFSQIKNLAGIVINAEEISKEAHVFPQFKIISSTPNEGSKNNDLTEFFLCSNLPLMSVNYDTKEAVKLIKMNLPYEFTSWETSYLVSESDAKEYRKCRAGEYQTRITYGLMPESKYEMKIRLDDQFGASLDYALKFETGKMPSHNLLFWHFQKRVILTTQDKTKLSFAAENMDDVDLHICRLEAESLMQLINDHPYYGDGPEIVKNCTKTQTVKIKLPRKYWIKNYFTIDLKKYISKDLGNYLLTFSNPNYKDWNDNKIKVHERVYVTVSNIGITEKKIEVGNLENDISKDKLKNLYWITDLKTLAPISGAEVKLFARNQSTTSTMMLPDISAVTNKDGIATFAATGTTDGIVVRKGNDSAFLYDSSNDSDNTLTWASQANSAKNVYTYSDRPIYRPGQKVFIKGLYRIGYDNNYEIFRDKKISLRVKDSKGNEIFSEERELNEYGTFDATVQIPADAPLGEYSIETDDSYSSFSVEEYVGAAFKLDLKSDKEEYISGESFNLDIDAAYYFGAPVDGGEVEYSIGSQDYYFDKYSNEYFSFGTDWYYCYYGCSYGDRFILRNKTTLDSTGKGKVSQSLDFSKLFPLAADRKSKIIVVYVTVKNSNGQAVSAQKSFIVHAGDFYIGLKPSNSFLSKNEKFNLKVKTVDVLGKPQGKVKMDLRLNKISWIQVKRKEVDGAYYYNSEEKLDVVSQELIETDSNGDFKKDFTIKDEGEYRFVASSTDSKGNVINSTYNIYVYGDGLTSIEPNNDNFLEIVSENKELKVGDEAEIIIKSPYKSAKALISLERGQIFDYKIVDIAQSLYSYKFKVTEDFVPNIFASAVLISGDPGVKFGSTEFRVNTDTKNVDIEVKTNKTEYLPGEEVNLSLRAIDSEKRPVQADVSVAVADLSVLALKGNPKKNPLVFFYGGFPLTVVTASNIKNILFIVDIPVGRTKGGGGSSPDDLAKKKRGEFKDTAFWESHVVTDQNGEASVKFTLPDNLTTWQIESLGITKDTKLGVAYSEIMSKKKLMLIPLKPRFIVAGDEFAIGAKIFNQSTDAQELQVSYESGGLELLDQKSYSIVIPAGKSDTVYFRVKAPLKPETGSHNFTLKAGNANLEDTVEQTLPIKANDTYETTATAGYSKEASVNEYLYIPMNVLQDKGGLTVNTAATLANFINDGLNSLLAYPYGCGEQIASKLDAIAIIKRGLKLDNVADKLKLKKVEYDGNSYTLDELVPLGLSELYKTQKDDGGFAYYSDYGQSNFYLSLHVAKTLKDLKKAGYKIDDGSFNRVSTYVLRFTNYTKNEKGDDLAWELSDEDFVYAAYVVSEIYDYKSIFGKIAERIKKFEKNDKFLNEEISSLGLANLAYFLEKYPTSFSQAYRDKVFKILENRITIDSRGAFLKSNQFENWSNFETPVKDTSGLLKALVLRKKDNGVLDRILRWLINSRSKDGAWGSTNSSLSAIDAFIDYISWQKETSSQFKLDVDLSGQKQAGYEFGPANIFSQESFNLDTATIGLGSLKKLSFTKTNLAATNNNFYYDLSLKYYLPAASIAPRDEGFTVERNYYVLTDKDFKTPVKNAVVGDLLKGRINIKVPKDRRQIALEDFIPAGVELVNFNLATENPAEAIDASVNVNENDRRPFDFRADWNKRRMLYPDKQEVRDDRLFVYKEYLSEGEYVFDYYVRVLVPGRFQWLPAQVSEMYFSENFGRTGGGWFVVNEKK